MQIDGRKQLRAGDLVRLRDPKAIISTLDSTGSLESVPFMPENLDYFGRNFRVTKRVEKICDTIDLCAMARRMEGTVYLDDLRCNGSGHGGCGARCRIFWKEAWLEKVDPDRNQEKSINPSDLAKLERLVTANAKRTDASGQTVFFCQATEANRASRQQPAWLPGQYVRELSCGNIGFGEFLTTAARVIYFKFLKSFRRSGLLPLELPVDDRDRQVAAPMQPGDWVEVKSFEEIAKTLDARARNRGLSFGNEMLPATGKKFRILDRLDRIVDEKTGRMIEFKNDCYILDGFYCKGDRSPGRWFCPKGVYAFWRGAWLRPVAAEQIKTETLVAEDKSLENIPIAAAYRK